MKAEGVHNCSSERYPESAFAIIKTSGEWRLVVEVSEGETRSVQIVHCPLCGAKLEIGIHKRCELVLEDMPEGKLKIKIGLENGVIDPTSGAHQLGWAAFRYIERAMNKMDEAEEGIRPDSELLKAPEERAIPFNPSAAIGLHVVNEEFEAAEGQPAPVETPLQAPSTMDQ